MNQKTSEEIRVNGERVVLERSKSLSEFVKSLELKHTSIALEYNRNLIEKENWCNITINSGDEIEILTIVDGG